MILPPGRLALSDKLEKLLELAPKGSVHPASLPDLPHLLRVKRVVGAYLLTTPTSVHEIETGNSLMLESVD